MYMYTYKRSDKRGPFAKDSLRSAAIGVFSVSNCVRFGNPECGWLPTVEDSRAGCPMLGGVKSTALPKHVVFIFFSLNTCFIKSVSLLHIFQRRQHVFLAEENA